MVHSLDVNLMEMLVAFAATGELGPLRCGLPLSEVEQMLGPGQPHPAIRMRPGIDGYPYTWHSLALEVTQQHISAVELRLYPGTIVRLPRLVLAEPVVDPIAILREDLTDELDLAGCRHDINDQLTFGHQSSIIVRDTGVIAVFSLPSRSFPAPHPDRHYLDVIYTSADSDTVTATQANQDPGQEQ